MTDALPHPLADRPLAGDAAPARPAPEPDPADLAADLALVAGLAAVPQILSVCLRASGMGIVAVARVTEARWVACAVLDRMGFGLAPGGELPVETTLCGRVRDTREPIVIEHASREAEWCDHPTPRTYGYESHVSVPIVLPDGSVFGTLVAIDPAPLPVRAPDTVATFTLFADLLAFEIDAARRLAASEARLGAARAEGALREQFIAVLGHDLRNPLAAIEAGARLVGREPLSDRARGVLELMRGSVARMAGLIDDVLDFARGRLGGGIPLRLADGAGLEAELRQIVAEVQSLDPDRPILAQLEAVEGLRCDPRRLGQLLSNLLANAATHGAPGRPIRVEAARGPGAVRITVANEGPTIPPELRERLFEPFVRGPDAAPAGGLGLGLYIARAIATAHGGALEVQSADGITRLVLTLPDAPAREAA